ncbi:hypothetical protein ACSJM2_23770 [Serratia marcescens]|uniref:hypothetical protein n=1 Tax=Serratia marcescens TaxID=615 RepID=UPI00148BBFBD|nr:hypothetical protein [Serratia marcescens]
MNRSFYLERFCNIIVKAELEYVLYCFGDELGKIENYPENINGIDSIHLYLSKKYGWSLNKCRKISISDLYALLHVEMLDWSLPDSAVFNIELPND